MTPSPADDRSEQGDPYERYVGRWSRRVAPLFIEWLDVPGGRRWLDVGCGTGALCAAIRTHAAPASVTGVEPSEGFLATARRSLPEDVTLCPGDAAAIPLPDASVDVVVSGLVLNFVPDVDAALAEAARVGAKGATFGAYVWDYAGRMDLIRYFWDTAVSRDAAAAALDEGARFPLCRPDALVATMTRAGFRDVRTTIGGWTLPASPVGRAISATGGVLAETWERVSGRSFPGVSKTTTGVKSRP